MPKVVLNSKKYPGITIPVPHIPGSVPPAAGGFHFAANLGHDVSEETAEAIMATFAQLGRNSPDFVADWNITVSGSEVSPAVEAVQGAIAAPALPPVGQPPVVEIPPETNPIEKPPVEIIPFEQLSTEDQELIAVEVSKLEDKTVAQGGALIESTAKNLDFPLELRVNYLRFIAGEIEAGRLKKGLKDGLDSLEKEIL